MTDQSATTFDEKALPVMREDAEKPPGASNPAVVSPFRNLGVVDTIKTFWLATLFCMMAAFNAFSDGYQYSIPGNIIALQGFIDQFGIEFHGKKALDAYTISAWSGAVQGALTFVLIIGPLPNDLLGRKFNFALVILFNSGATLLEMFAKSWKVWLAAKILSGLSVGLVQATASVYVSEMAPTNARGALLAVYQLYFALGQTFSAIVVEIVSKQATHHWRRTIYSTWVFTGLTVIFWFFIPESARWLCTKGKHDRAKQILQRVNGRVKGYDVETEYAILLQEVEEGRQLSANASKYSVWACFRGTNLRRTLISFFPIMWQQWTGGVVIFGYTAYFFQQAGVKEVFIGTIVVFIILVIFVGVSFFVVEKFGRRPLLLGGGLGMVVCLLIVGGVATVSPQSSATGGIIVAFSAIWVAVYALSAGPLAYVFLGETSTVVLRAKTTGFAAAMASALTLIPKYCSPILLSPTAANWGVKGVSFFYAGTCFLGTVAMYFFIPETRGRTYIQLDDLFARKVSARQFKVAKSPADDVDEEDARV